METAKIVIFGNGKAAVQVAHALVQKGGTVIIATSQQAMNLAPEEAELLTEVALDNISAAPKGYDLTFSRGAESISHHAARIVLCDEYQRAAEFARYGLVPCDQVTALSQMVATPETFTKKNGSVAFLTGIYRESNPLILRETLLSASHLAVDHAQKVYILTGNLKVAAQGLEALYREARQAGVTLIKFNREKPFVEQKQKGNAVLTFKDEITDHLFRLTPDLTVVDEIVAVSEITKKVAGILALHKDQDGFAQADNVHRLPIKTNRRGILAAGPSRAVMDLDQQDMDAGNVSLACAMQIEAEDSKDTGYAEIDPGQCVRCLTCFRLCPFGAVVVESRVRVAANFCEGCGICAAECPKTAIDMQQLAAGTPREQMKRMSGVKAGDDFEPAVFAFCCNRSAVPAASLASCMGHRLPGGLKIIQVPCAGAVSTGDLLNAFQNKADGVLVLTCHIGNCHAQEGNQHALRRAEQAQNALDRVGLEKGRLMRSTLASNMSAEFNETVIGFAEKLKQMGPSGA